MAWDNPCPRPSSNRERQPRLSRVFWPCFSPKTRMARSVRYATWLPPHRKRESGQRARPALAIVRLQDAAFSVRPRSAAAKGEVKREARSHDKSASPEILSFRAKRRGHRDARSASGAAPLTWTLFSDMLVRSIPRASRWPCIPGSPRRVPGIARACQRARVHLSARGVYVRGGVASLRHHGGRDVERVGGERWVSSSSWV